MRPVQLLYFSTKRSLGPGGIFALEDEVRVANEKAGLTGVLLFNRSYFLQVLEGDREVATRAFIRIAGDRRHHGVTLMSFHETEQRDFADWSMGLVDSTSPELSVTLKDFLPVYDLVPAKLSVDAAMGILRRMHDMRLTVRR
jgi:hypothetical protein